MMGHDGKNIHQIHDYWWFCVRREGNLFGEGYKGALTPSVIFYLFSEKEKFLSSYDSIDVY